MVAAAEGFPRHFLRRGARAMRMRTGQGGATAVQRRRNGGAMAVAVAAVTAWRSAIRTLGAHETHF